MRSLRPCLIRHLFLATRSNDKKTVLCPPKLRQGVGRLIRSKKDKGICVILDNRVLTKSYGRAFLAAMPDCPVEIVT